MSTPKHTPEVTNYWPSSKEHLDEYASAFPVKLELNNDGQLCERADNGSWDFVADTKGSVFPDRAIAAELVRRWNTQPELLEACKAALADESTAYAVAEKLRAAITKATQ